MFGFILFSGAQEIKYLSVYPLGSYHVKLTQSSGSYFVCFNPFAGFLKEDIS